MNRLQAHRAQRQRVVFRSLPVPVWFDDPEPVRSSSALRVRLERARLGVLTRHCVPTRARRMMSRRRGLSRVISTGEVIATGSVSRLGRHGPFSSLGASVSRPLGDVAITVQLLPIS